jgi:SH3-like domain-containing protein
MCLGVAACSREGRSARLDLPSDGGAAAPVADPSAHLVAAVSTLRRLPSEQARVTVQGSKAPVVNAIAVLQRGERVTLVERRGDWARVRASDGTEGWVRGAALVPGDAVQEGTLLVAAWAFDRPDLLTVNAKRKLEPGTLLFIRKTKDLFSEVDAGAGSSVWVLTDRVSVRPGDLESARLVEKARYLARGDRREEAREVLALLRSRSPDSPLVAVLASELGEAPPDAGQPVGAGAAGSGPGAEARSPP